VQRLIERFLALGLPVEPALSDQRVQRLAQQLAAEIPAPVQELYRAFGGLPSPSDFPMRLMPPDEVVEIANVLADQAEWLHPATQARYFWTDDNSNYAGVFVEGPLVGKVCYLDHDEPDEVARFRTVQRFFEGCLRIREGQDEARDWYELATDYPARSLSPEEERSDGALADEMRRRLDGADGEEYARIALHVVQLTPPSRTAELMELLHSQSPWVQERACQMMGLRDHAPAIEVLEAIVRADKANNPVIASIYALGRMSDPRAREVLVALEKDHPDFDIYFDEALGR